MNLVQHGIADLASRSFAILAGLILVAFTVVSIMRTVVVPRSLNSSVNTGVTGFVRWTTRSVARLRKGYIGRDAALAWAGPTIILLNLIVWLLLFLVSYGVLIYGVSGMSLGDAFRQAGSSLFTLGFAGGTNSDQTIIDFIAAATGPIVIALLIGFLPTIYQTYLDRESAITLLSAMAGDPVWGPELLSRSALSDTLDELPSRFADWSNWAGTLRLTHTTYAALLYIRSPRYQRHFSTSLMAMMDAAALHIATNTKVAHDGAYAVLLQGVQTLDHLYVTYLVKRSFVERLPYFGAKRRRPANHDMLPLVLATRNPGRMAVIEAANADAARLLSETAFQALKAGENHQLQITREMFDHAISVLKQAGFPIDEDIDEAWKLFGAMRQRYEYTGEALCRFLDAPRTPWSGERDLPLPVMWPRQATEFLPGATKLAKPATDETALQ